MEISPYLNIEVFDHWVVFNIPLISDIEEGSSPEGVNGKNGADENKYTGPCPPAEYEPKEHRYFFKLYALDGELELNERATKNEVEKAMEGHVLAKGELIGKYSKG